MSTTVSAGQNLGNAIPKELAEILRREFNTGVPQIATLAAVVAGTFGVSQVFNAGVWTVVAIVMFVLVFLFQQQVPSSVPRTALYVSILLGFTTASLLEAYRYGGPTIGFGDWSHVHGNLVTGLASAGTTASIALLTVSYRKQRIRIGAQYPLVIEKAVTDQLNSSPFYKRKVIFKIALLDCNEASIELETTHSYEVVNRFEDARTWLAQYELNSREHGKIIQFTVDGKPQDIEKFSGARLVQVPVALDGREAKEITIKVHDRFRLIDSDIYTSYHPATDLRVEFTNTKNPGLAVEFDTLHVSKYNSEGKGDTRFVYMPDGVLPFEGVRLRWRPS